MTPPTMAPSEQTPKDCLGMPEKRTWRFREPLRAHGHCTSVSSCEQRGTAG